MGFCLLCRHTPDGKDSNHYTHTTATLLRSMEPYQHYGGELGSKQSEVLYLLRHHSCWNSYCTGMAHSWYGWSSSTHHGTGHTWSQSPQLYTGIFQSYKEKQKTKTYECASRWLSNFCSQSHWCHALLPQGGICSYNVAHMQQMFTKNVMTGI